MLIIYRTLLSPPAAAAQLRHEILSFNIYALSTGRRKISRTTEPAAAAAAAFSLEFSPFCFHYVFFLFSQPASVSLLYRASICSASSTVFISRFVS